MRRARVILGVVVILVVMGQTGVARAGSPAPDSDDLRLPRPSPAVIDLTWNASPPSIEPTRSSSLILRPAAIQRPSVSAMSSSAACAEARRERDLGIALTIVCALGLPLGFMGAHMGKNSGDSALLGSGATLVGVAAVGLPVGLVLGGQAATANRKHGCWGAVAAEAEPAPPPVIVFSGFEEQQAAQEPEPAEAEPVEQEPVEAEQEEPGQGEPEPEPEPEESIEEAVEE